MVERLVIKIGSNVLTRSDGTLDVTRMSALVDQIVRLRGLGYEIIVVSSGAVACGRSLVKKHGKLDSVEQRQLYSAVGQVRLINLYYSLFRDYGISIGQVLTMKESFATRKEYRNQRSCMEVMLANGVIPIVNENDTVSVTELMFTDNDELSGLVASMMDAQNLVILSNIDGIYDGDPADPASKVIRRVEPDDDLSGYIRTGKSSFGRGGMLTKENTQSLKYCTKVKYLDLGHNLDLDDISFVSYMPDLEVLIAALNFVEDFSPVEDCPKLEYVEAFTSRLHDLTPFANLQNLRHLNIGYNFAVTDISPLYGLKNLERLWIGEHDPVPPEQIAKFRELHPNCIVNDTTPDPTEEYWRFAEHGDEMGNQRYDPRYELLREQMGYSEEAYAYNWLDPLYPYFEYDRQVVPDPDVVDFADLFDVY